MQNVETDLEGPRGDPRICTLHLCAGVIDEKHKHPHMSPKSPLLGGDQDATTSEA